MTRNKHEISKNLNEYVNEREQWCKALASNTAPFALKNLVYAHVRNLDRRIQNLQWVLDTDK